MDYFKQNFWIAGSGIVSERYLRWTAEIVGTERMVYSTDYPYTFGTRPGGFPFLDTSNGVGRSFLENACFTHGEKAVIGSGNCPAAKSCAAVAGQGVGAERGASDNASPRLDATTARTPR